MRRSQVKPNHIARFFDEDQIGERLEGLGSVQLQVEAMPDLRDHGLDHFRPLSHSPSRLMGRTRRLAL